MNNNIYVIGYPKSGNTWLVRLLARVLKCEVIEHPIKGKGYDIAANVNKEIKKENDYVIYKIHYMPEQFIEMFGDIKDKKIVYIKRDIKDVIISSYFYFANQYKLRNDLFGYIMHFCHHGNAQFDTWKNHVKEWEKNNNNITTYEKLKNDAMKELRNILIKLQLSDNVNDNDIKHAVENELFEKRKVQENFFLRKGIVGDYKNYMDKEMINYINEEMEK